jgi:hypothetical protein
MRATGWPSCRPPVRRAPPCGCRGRTHRRALKWVAMPRTDGCWANVLDDCQGPLTGEHTPSVAAWPGVEGKQNRRGRLRQPVDVKGTGRHAQPDQRRAVRRLTRPILCGFHNSATNVLDTTAGQLARAIDWFIEERENRLRTPHGNGDARTVEVDGRMVERWFLKSIINNEFGCDLPIGDPNERAGWPTRQLVGMVFDRRPVRPPYGLFLVDVPGQRFTFGRHEFRFSSLVGPAGTHIVCGLLEFRGLTFGVNLTNSPLAPSVFDRPLGFENSRIHQPFHELNCAQTNVHVRLRW